MPQAGICSAGGPIGPPHPLPADNSAADPKQQDPWKQFSKRKLVSSLLLLLTVPWELECICGGHLCTMSEVPGNGQDISSMDVEMILIP